MSDTFPRTCGPISPGVQMRGLDERRTSTEGDEAAPCERRAHAVARGEAGASGAPARGVAAICDTLAARPSRGRDRADGPSWSAWWAFPIVGAPTEGAVGGTQTGSVGGWIRHRDLDTAAHCGLDPGAIRAAP